MLVGWLLCAVSVVVAAAVVVSFAFAAGLTFADPAGDAAQGAPDVTSVTIQAPNAPFVIVLVTAGGFEATKSITVLLDTDKNPTTGGAGAEYAVGVRQTVAGSSLYAARWDGSAWRAWTDAERSVPLSFGFSHHGDVFGWAIYKADVVGESAFEINFSVETRAWDVDGQTIVGSDRAPDEGQWAYPPAPTNPPVTTPTPATPAAVVKPVIGKPVANPARVVAGKRMTVTFPVTRRDSGAPLTSGTMVCDPSVAGRQITHAESFKAGKARLTFVVPKTAKGKRLKVKIKIVNGAQSATKIATFHIS